MSQIRVLPPELASQIAAGEVVERPASAIKELIENSLDAQARRIHVEVEAGGVTRMAVIDDGHGMSAEDAELSVQRHATSKLRAISDLNQVRSFGFRGEALPSIASVSRFRLRTRTEHSDEGVELDVEAGRASQPRPTGCPVGTQIEVRDLFFSVPPRRKFLRSSGTEAGHIAEVVDAAALSHPEVTFVLERDGRKVRQWLRAADREQRVRDYLGEESLAVTRGERGPLRLEAFLSRPERARAGAGGLKIFVNNRPVRDRGLAVTVAQAYGSVLERGRYPRGVVYVDLPPQLVDINVHPQKGEVRFADPRALTDAVYHLLRVSLSQAFSLPPRGSSSEPASTPLYAKTQSESPQPLADGGASTPLAAGEDPSIANAAALAAASTARLRSSSFSIESASGAPADPFSPEATDDSKLSRTISPSEKSTWSSLRFLAQVKRTYLICEGDEGLFVIDQHAAAERVTFDRLRRQYRTTSLPSQTLLFPAIVETTTEETAWVKEHEEAFRRLGLEIEVRGEERISVHSIPKLLQRASAERLVRDLIQESSRQGGRAFSDAIDLRLATMACHGSVRAGDALGAEEATALLRALDHADFAGHCPHGRPVVTMLSWTELERKVGRR